MNTRSDFEVERLRKHGSMEGHQNSKKLLILAMMKPVSRSEGKCTHWCGPWISCNFAVCHFGNSLVVFLGISLLHRRPFGGLSFIIFCNLMFPSILMISRFVLCCMLYFVCIRRAVLFGTCFHR